MRDHDEAPKDWKLKLRYGRMDTPYLHFATISDGVFVEPSGEFSCPSGPAFMSMRVWALDKEEAVQMASVFGRQVGFSIKGNVQVYAVPPQEPPRDNPYGYDISFRPYDP